MGMPLPLDITTILKIIFFVVLLQIIVFYRSYQSYSGCKLQIFVFGFGLL